MATTSPRPSCLVKNTKATHAKNWTAWSYESPTHNLKPKANWYASRLPFLTLLLRTLINIGCNSRAGFTMALRFELLVFRVERHYIRFVLLYLVTEGSTKFLYIGRWNDVACVGGLTSQRCDCNLGRLHRSISMLCWMSVSQSNGQTSQNLINLGAEDFEPKSFGVLDLNRSNISGFGDTVESERLSGRLEIELSSAVYPSNELYLSQQASVCIWLQTKVFGWTAEIWSSSICAVSEDLA